MGNKSKFNKSTTYILPVILDHLRLEFPEMDEEFIIENLLKQLKQTYILHNNENFFILDMNPCENSEKLLYVVEKSVIFAKCITNDNQLAIFFNIPDNCLSTFSKFLYGEYSKICEVDKQSILEFTRDYFSENVYDIVYSILYKDKKYIEYIKKEFALDYFDKDWECGSKININDETYEYSAEENAS